MASAYRYHPAGGMTAHNQMQVGGVSHTIITGPTLADPFRISRYRNSGWAQICLGIAAIICQIIDLALAATLWREFVAYVTLRPPTDRRYFLSLTINGKYYRLTSSESHYEDSINVAYICAGMWLGLLFILTGSFGAAMTDDRKHKRGCLASTYMVLSVLCTAFMAPALICFAAAELGLGSALAAREVRTYLRPIGPVLLLLIGIAENVVTMYACCLSRCGSQLPQSETPCQTQGNVLIMGPQTAVTTQYPHVPQQSGRHGPPPSYKQVTMQ